jgi:hypothetical protein
MKPKPRRGAGRTEGPSAFSKFTKGKGPKRPFKYESGDSDAGQGYGGYKKKEPWRSQDKPFFSKEAAAPVAKKLVVSSGRMRQGVREAKDEISEMVHEIVNNLKAIKNLKTVELDLAFDGSGNFAGIGEGAAATVRISVGAE